MTPEQIDKLVCYVVEATSITPHFAREQIEYAREIVGDSMVLQVLAKYEAKERGDESEDYDYRRPRNGSRGIGDKTGMP